MSTINLRSIQKSLAESRIDGWFFCDFQGSDPVGRSILQIPALPPQTRRWYYFIPAEGAPSKIVHSIERTALDHLPGKKHVYLGWREREHILRTVLKGHNCIAAQYSPDSNIPNISRLDAGTYELLQGMKLTLVSSADLVQVFGSRWTKAELNTHVNAAKQLHEIMLKTFRLIKRRINGHEEVTEIDLQKNIIQELNRRGLMFDHPPMIAAGVNTSNPHYMPTEKNYKAILPGELVLINLWARERTVNGVYAVITWMGYTGREVPEKFARPFDLICGVRDETIRFIGNSLQDKKILRGYQVDDFTRNLLKEADYESYFLHRTGHSIGREINAYGANLDNLETHDERPLIPDTCFSVEPALYFSDFGLRSEVNVFLGSDGLQVTTQPVQKEITAILK